MTNKCDKYLIQILESSLPRDQNIPVRIKIAKSPKYTSTNYREYIDEHQKTQTYEIFQVKDDINKTIYDLSNRILVKNFDLIPGMSVEMSKGNLFEIDKAEYIESIELSTSARLHLDESTYNINAHQNASISSYTRSLVSIIDTGINNINSLNNKLSSTQNYTFESENDNYGRWDNSGHTSHGHGTVMANIISYFSPNSRFINCKAIHSNVIQDKNAPDKSFAEKAVDYSVSVNANIINMSLGFLPCSNKICTLCEAVNRAVKIGLNVIVAAGNTSRSPPDDPGQAEDAITVGACTKPGYIYEKSNHGPTNFGIDKPDIVAPGRAVAVKCSLNGLEHRSGTSISTAIVSGIVTHLRYKNSNPYSVKNALINTATKLIDRDGNEYDKNIQGAGRIDAKAAYDYL